MVAHLVRKNRSEKTITGYRDHVERIFAEGLDTPLRELGADSARVARRHDDISAFPCMSRSGNAAIDGPAPLISTQPHSAAIHP